jgi:hypothetical protein
MYPLSVHWADCAVTANDRAMSGSASVRAKKSSSMQNRASATEVSVPRWRVTRLIPPSSETQSFRN